MKSKIYSAILVIAVIVLISGVTVMALATPGSPENPFVSLDYLNSIFKPQVLEEVSNTEAELTRTFNERLSELEARLEAEYGSAEPSPGGADAFAVVTLNSGQTLTCSVGVEIMLRIGTATAFGSSPALVNYTSGETLSDGGSLVVNNMYLVTIEGNGIRATADMVRVLVRGEYTIS